jgi:hypothetical protein
MFNERIGGMRSPALPSTKFLSYNDPAEAKGTAARLCRSSRIAFFRIRTRPTMSNRRSRMMYAANARPQYPRLRCRAGSLAPAAHHHSRTPLQNRNKRALQSCQLPQFRAAAATSFAPLPDCHILKTMNASWPPRRFSIGRTTSDLPGQDDLLGQLSFFHNFLVESRGDHRFKLNRSKSIGMAYFVKSQHYASVGRCWISGTKTPSEAPGCIFVLQRDRPCTPSPFNRIGPRRENLSVDREVER